MEGVKGPARITGNKIILQLVFLSIGDVVLRQLLRRGKLVTVCNRKRKVATFSFR